MRKLVYSPHYREKLQLIKYYLELQFGSKVRKKVLRAITGRLHMLELYPDSGVSLNETYGIETDYQYVFVAHNYVFYRVASDTVYIIDIYNEREDYMKGLFNITQTDDEANEY